MLTAANSNSKEATETVYQHLMGFRMSLKGI